MRAKTIKAILAKKHQEWVDSIDDVAVQDMVKRNTIITGGCIVSMLLGEKVSDYDIYFTNKATVLAVAQYYAAKFKELNPGTQEIEVREDIDSEGNFTGRVRVFIKSTGVEGERVDEFFDQNINPDDPATYAEKDDYIDHLTEIADQVEDKPKYRPIFFTSNAITLSNKVQLIIRFYGDPAEIHSNYDFVHCTSYWTPDGTLVLPAAALESILTRELIYRGSKYPLASVIRTRKFVQRGWRINAGQYLKMCLQLSELDLLDIKVLEDQLVGVDFGYFRMILDYLQTRIEEDNDFRLTSNYLIEVIDRLF